MNLVEVVILVGAQCLSPMETGPGFTVVGKVPCAVLVRQDPETADIEIVPPSAATDPDVIAMLVKPRVPEPDVAIAKGDRLVPLADDITGSISPAAPPRIVPASAPVEPVVARPRARPLVTRRAGVKPAVARKQVVMAKRSDACGSSRAVWYTNKDGHRRYRCVKRG